MGSRRITTARPLAAVCALLTLTLLNGCGLIGSTSRPTAPQVGGLTISSPLKTTASGLPASLTPVGTFEWPRGEREFSLFYWSQGQRVQGYLDVPYGKGPFPLLVELHGGSVFSQPPATFGQPPPEPHSKVGAWSQTNAANFAWPAVVVFFPNYAGYGPSDGPVGNVHSNYVDVINGLTALSHLQGLHLAPHETYLLGISMGGALAMMVAEQDKQVQAVSLLSPYPGDIAMMEWLQSQSALDTTDEQFLNDFNFYYGGYHGARLSSPKYRENSFSYQSVGHLPILIMAGNSDPVLPPSLMEMMYQHLHQYDPNVTLKFFPGGHAPWSQAIAGAWEAWLYSYGI